MNLGALIDGSAPLHKTAHLAIIDHFKSRRYLEIAPNQSEDAPRVLLRQFYEQDDMFSLTNETLKQLRTVYKVDNQFEIQFAASFFVVELDKYLVTYLDVIKTKKNAQRRGLDSQFVRDLVEFLEQQLTKDPQLKGGHFFVGQSQTLRSHEFFKEQDFGPVPDQFKHLEQNGCDLAYRQIRRAVEEEKNQNNQQEVEDINGGKSCVSALTSKTNKSKSGKTLDKHCLQCSFKLIKGSNWSRHCKDVHKGVIVQGKKCGIDCFCPKGKSQKITKSASLAGKALR